MESLYTILAIVACLLLFSLAIFIHEFGHFLAARLLGVRVDRFSIGFGPALWKKQIGDVEYRISAIPFGGYVALPELDPEGTDTLQGGTDKEAKPIRELPPWKRIIVAFAGPFGNIVLAVVLAVGLSLVPGAHFGEVPAEIGGVYPDGPAAKAGMQVGDKVLAVNGHAVRTWTDMQTEIQIVGDKAAEFLVCRSGTNVTLSLVAKQEKASGARFILAYSSTNYVANAAAWMPNRNPLRQLEWDAGNIVRILKALATPREAKAAASAIGGPVMIAEGLYNQVRRNGWDAMGFLRFLNVNLAMINLLPLPILDGGLILIALIELLFRRKPPKKFMDTVTMAFLYLFLLLFVVLCWRDVARSRRIHKAADEMEARYRRTAAYRQWVKNFKPAFNLNPEEKPAK